MSLKQILTLFILIIFLLPTISIAETYDITDCDSGSIDCTCEGSTISQPDDEQIKSINDCQDTCEMFSKLDDTVTGYSIQ